MAFQFLEGGKKLPFAIFFLISFLFSSNASAQETKLDEIVVTATRIEETKSDLPYSVRIITERDIKTSVAKNAGDLIAESALGHVHKYPGLSTSRIGLRGFDTDLFDDIKSRVLILINGNRTGTVNFATIPTDDIERIEIVKGPASVLYGSSAMGGVINIITKKANNEGVNGSVGIEAGSWGFIKTMAELKIKKEPFDFYLSASRSSIDDYSAKYYGKIENTGYDEEFLSARFGYNIFKNHHISLGFQHWKGWDIGSPGARYEPDIDDKKEIERNRIEINYKTENFNANYYFNNDRRENYEGSQTGKWETPGEISMTKTKTQGLSILKILPIDEHRILIGGQWDRINIKSSRNTGSPYNPKSQYDSYGLFTEGRLSLLEKKLIIHAGLRYDYFENKILSTEGIKNLKPREENLDNFTFRGGLLYKITENLHIKSNAGTAFRVPTPEELASDFISGGKRYIGNSQLKPEKSASYEIGISYTKESLKSEITFFHSKFKNKILRYEDTILNAYTYKNVDGATIQGFEGEFSYELSQILGVKFLLEPFANFIYHTRYVSKDETEISKYGKTLTYIPKWTGAFGMKVGQENWDLRLIGNYMGDEKVIDWSPSGKGKVVTKGDFTVFTLNTSYRPIKNFEITASIENLFDRAYEYVQYYPMPRRTFTAGMKWIF